MKKQVIHIYGASGSGTSTLGRAISDAWNFSFLDTDDYFWLPTNPKYTVKRAVSERILLLRRDIAASQRVVLSGSLVDWGDELIPLFTLAIRLETATAVRMARLKEREAAEFGTRILPGGDMYQQHQDFLQWAAQYDTGSVNMRSSANHDAWQKLLPCRKIVLNGANPIAKNLELVKQELQMMNS